MRRFVQFETKGMCDNLKRLFLLVWSKEHMIPIYVLMHQFSLSFFLHKGRVAICLISFQFISSDFRLLVVERFSKCQDNRLNIPFLVRLLAPDYIGVGGSLT